MNVRNFVLTFKLWLGETSPSFKKRYKHVQIEYGEIMNTSEISNVDIAIDNGWNVYNHQKVPDKKSVNF